MDANTKVAAGMKKFQEAIKPTAADENQTDGEQARIDKKRLALTIAKVAAGTGVLIAAWKIGTMTAAKVEDPQEDNA